MKKLICLLLALLVCMGSFASCKKTPADQKEPAAEAQTQAAEAPEHETLDIEETFEAPSGEELDSGSSTAKQEVAGSDTQFAPSVTYKGGPEIITAELEGQNVLSCIVVTSIEQAKKKTTDIRQDERDELVEVYEKLLSGEMLLPIEGKHVIRELVDISFKYNACRQKTDHGNKPEQLAKENVLLTLDLQLPVTLEENMVVYAYIDEEWVEIPGVINNGDGTVTGAFEDVCPVAFVVLQ